MGRRVVPAADTPEPCAREVPVRSRIVALLAALLAACLLAVFAGSGDAEPLEQRTVGPRTHGTGQIAWRRVGPEKWAYRYRTALVELRAEPTS